MSSAEFLKDVRSQMCPENLEGMNNRKFTIPTLRP